MVHDKKLQEAILSATPDLNGRLLLVGGEVTKKNRYTRKGADADTFEVTILGWGVDMKIEVESQDYALMQLEDHVVLRGDLVEEYGKVAPGNFRLAFVNGDKALNGKLVETKPSKPASAA